MANYDARLIPPSDKPRETFYYEKDIRNNALEVQYGDFFRGCIHFEGRWRRVYRGKMIVNNERTGAQRRIRVIGSMPNSCR